MPKTTPKTYNLPTGATTRSARRYVREWNALSKPVAQALGCEVVAVDPSVHLVPVGASRGFQLPVAVAMRIKDLIP